MLDFIVKMDYWLFMQINSVFTSSAADAFFFHITDLHKTLIFKIVVIPLVFFFFYKKYRRPGITYFIFLLLAITVNDFAGAKVKDHYGRPRPANNPEISVNLRSDAGGYSFYSNHASNMFTFAAYTSAFFPAAQIPLFILAGLVGYSRVYNGVHYPTDVFAGTIVGLLWGWFFSFLARRLVDWAAARKVES